MTSSAAGSRESQHSPEVVVIVTDLIVFRRHSALVHEIRERGYEPAFIFGPETSVTELSQWMRDPGKPVFGVEHVHHVSEVDLDSLLHAVRKVQQTANIAAVISCGEVFVEAVGVVAEALGLAGAGSHAARVSRNKALQRLSTPALAPPWQFLGRERILPATSVGFPAVLKPVSRMSSSGVHPIQSLQEFEAVINSYPEREAILIEARVQGPEYSVESLVLNGVVQWAGITAKETNEATTVYFTEIGHTSPAVISTQQQELLLKSNSEVLAAIHFETGVCHAEFRLTDSGPILMEIATRPPGDAISKLWHLATGKSMESAIVSLSLGRSSDLGLCQRRARQVYLEQPVGRLCSVTTDSGVPVTWVQSAGLWPAFSPASSTDPARICAIIVSKRPGDRIGPMTDSNQRAVSVVVDCPLTDDIDLETERLVRMVNVTYSRSYNESCHNVESVNIAQRTRN